jgi:hypothetical protein
MPIYHQLIIIIFIFFIFTYIILTNYYLTMRRKTMRGRGAIKTLRNWANNTMNVIKKHGPGIIRDNKLGSKALTAISNRSDPKYRPYINKVNDYVKMKGYGLRSAGMGLRSAGGALRSVGGMRRRRR